MTALRAPFPYFGGKSRAASLVWEALGDVPNFVEPFFGSGAVLLGRPTRPRTETVNDLNAMLANFWRALKHDPEAVAAHADYPVNECDLHARHRWLVNQVEFRERMRRDPDHYDARVAGWWVWGISMWIGGGWCATGDDETCDSARVPLIQGHAGVTKHRGVDARGREDSSNHAKRQRQDAGAGVVKISDRDEVDPGARRPHLGGAGHGTGVHSSALGGRPDVPEQMPKLGVSAPGNGSSIGGVHRESERLSVEPGERIPQVANPGRGVDAPARFSKSSPREKKPYTDARGRGVHRRALSEQVPLLTGDGIDPHSVARRDVEDDPVGGAKRPNLGSASSLGVLGPIARKQLVEEFVRLAARLRDVRVCCGDWSRVLTPAVTTGHGLTGVLLDPPYELGERASGLYAHDGTENLCASVRKWALENGDDPLMRIAYCGYGDGPDEELTRAGWRFVEWKAQGGFGAQRKVGKNENAHRERIWLSPHCLIGQRGLFA